MSSDRPSRKRKTDDSTRNNNDDNMGGTLSKYNPFVKKNEAKTEPASKSAKIEEEEPASEATEVKPDVVDEVKTDATSTDVLEQRDEKETTPSSSDKIVDDAEVEEEPSDKTVKLSPSKGAAKEEPSSDEKSIVADDAEEQKADTSSVDDAPPPLERQDDGPAEQLLPLDDTPESSPNASPVKQQEKKKEESDEEVEVEKVVVKKQGSSSSLRSRKPKTMADMGYHFNDEGKLRAIEDDSVFKFTTQKAYEELGDLIGEHVYELMLQAGLVKKYLEVNRNRRFYFVSPGYEQKARILVLIHGSGVVKAGQWARKLIINESLQRGAQLEYIARALALDWGVVVLNYNEKCEGQEDRCHAPDSHGAQEWKHAFRRANSEIVVVAHSYGGSVISDCVRTMRRQEDHRVKCVALTDSWFSEGKEVYAVNWNTQKKQLHRSSGTYQMYSGDNTHEGTSAACINAVFALLEAVTHDMDDEEFCDLLEISEDIILKESKERIRKKREENGETESTKSLELVGEKENNLKKEAKKAKGEEKEKANGDKKDEGEADAEVKNEAGVRVEEAKEDDGKNGQEEEEKEAKEGEKKDGAELKKDEEEEVKTEETKEEEEVKEDEDKPTVNKPAVRRRERSPSDNDDDSDEGVQKDVSSPEKSDNDE